MNYGRFRPAIEGSDADESVVWPAFGIFDKDIEIAVFVKDAGIQELELRVLGATIAVFRNQSGVRKLDLRIFVERLLVGVGRSSIKIEITFLDILAVVALAVGQAEQAFLEDGILAIPKSWSETEAALAVAPTEEAIFTPAVNAASRVIVRKIVPAGTAR